MSTELSALSVAAASIAFFHTALGVDHYLPFVMISWARKWSAGKTAFVTLLCGMGHIASSITLGLGGVLVGLAIGTLKVVDLFRDNLAAWLLIAFGLIYLVWGLRQAYHLRRHSHNDSHMGEDTCPNTYGHLGVHTHIHPRKALAGVGPWMLFIIFVLGPCKPLIPFLMYPAARNSLSDLVVVASVFGIVTVFTMVAAVIFFGQGVGFLPLDGVQRFSHVIAGSTICLCGLAIVFLGL